MGAYRFLRVVLVKCPVARIILDYNNFQIELSVPWPDSDIFIAYLKYKSLWQTIQWLKDRAYLCTALLLMNVINKLETAVNFYI